MTAAAWALAAATCWRQVHDTSPCLTATESCSALVLSNCWSVSAIVGYLGSMLNRIRKVSTLTCHTVPSDDGQNAFVPTCREQEPAVDQRHAPRPASKSVRERLIDAAEVCLRAKGIRSTTVSEVAEAAGVSRGWLYRHFPDKNSLLGAAIVRLNDAYWSRVPRRCSSRSPVSTSRSRRASGTAAWPTPTPARC